MTDGKPGVRAILRINGRMLVVMFMAGYGWLFWQMASPQLWEAWLIALISFAASAVGFVGVLVQVVKLILHQWRLAKFAAQGSKARVDRLADEDDLQKRGMIR